MNADRIAATLMMVLLGSTAPAIAKDSGAERSSVDTIVIHAIGGKACDEETDTIVQTPAGGSAGTWKDFFEGHDMLGIHYIVDREGDAETSIPEDQVANHALGRNQSSIGIELVNLGDGEDPYPEAQMDTLVGLVREIRDRWDVELDGVVRHSEIDDRSFECAGEEVKQKQDPGDAFDWDGFRARLEELAEADDEIDETSYEVELEESDEDYEE